MQLRKKEGERTRDAGNVEVEIKAAVPDLGRVSNRLVERGATPRGRHREQDIYYQHPTRDFAETDEALRVRISEEGLELTYKGPKVDDETKTREELTLNVNDAHTAQRMLERLGFQKVATIEKHRQLFQVRGLTVALDQVDGLGTYAEIEKVVGHGDVDEVRARVKKLAKELGLEDLETRSYLELLLAQQGSQE